MCVERVLLYPLPSSPLVGSIRIFMYRRPILCTLYGAVDFLKVLKIAVVGVGEVLLDSWEEVLGRNVYITSQYFFYD